MLYKSQLYSQQVASSLACNVNRVKCSVTGSRRANQAVPLQLASSETIASASVASDDELQIDMQKDTEVDGIATELSQALSLPVNRVAYLLKQQPMLAKLSPNSLASRVLELAQGLSVKADYILNMVSRKPSVLQVPVQDILSRIAQLAEALGVDPPTALPLAVRQPLLLDVSPAALASHTERISSALDMDPGAVLLLLARLRPAEMRSVLALPNSVLEGRLAALYRLISQRLGQYRSSDARLLLARAPQLLATSPTSIAASLDTLLDELRASPRVISDILANCPGLLVVPAPQLRESMDAWALLLRLEREQLTDLVLAQPRILKITAKQMQANLEYLTCDMYIPRKFLMSLLERQPQLLAYSAQSLGQKIEALQNVLGLQYDSVLSMVGKNPSLLGISPTSLSVKTARMGAAFGLGRPQVTAILLAQPIVLTFSSERLEELADTLMRITRLDVRSLGRLVRRHPFLLLKNGSEIRGIVGEVETILGLNTEEVCKMVSQNPDFLSGNIKLWQTNFDTLVSLLGISRDTARAVMRAQPKVLAMGAATLHRHCSRLGALLNSHPKWRAQIGNATPEQIYYCLLYGRKELNHLRYLVDNKLQSSQPLFDPVLFGRLAFARAHPKYEDWEEAHAAELGLYKPGMPLKLKVAKSSNGRLKPVN